MVRRSAGSIAAGKKYPQIIAVLLYFLVFGVMINQSAYAACDGMSYAQQGVVTQVVPGSQGNQIALCGVVYNYWSGSPGMPQTSVTINGKAGSWQTIAKGFSCSMNRNASGGTSMANCTGSVTPTPAPPPGPPASQGCCPSGYREIGTGAPHNPNQCLPNVNYSCTKP
jgi:hypothetical protein